MNYFREKGVWLKGNMHLHSTNSDGLKTVEELVSIYKEHGYGFLVLSDHNKISEPPQGVIGITVIKGIEIGSELTHAVGVGVEQIPVFTPDNYRNILAVRKKAKFSFLCHPYWSNLDLSHFQALKEFQAFEVFNTGCELEIARGYSEYVWDNALSAGIRMNAVATDDSHQVQQDYCGGWVSVRAADASEESILKSLNAGDYYSSNGPEIKDAAFDGKKIFVKSSRCRQIRFIANTYQGAFYENSKGMTEAEYKLTGKETYIRVECVDKEGKKAWTNPVYP